MRAALRVLRALGVLAALATGACDEPSNVLSHGDFDDVLVGNGFSPIECTTVADCPARACEDVSCDGVRCDYRVRAVCTQCEDDGGCDDANLCTTDACQAGECRHDAITCDDARACTTNVCDPLYGCRYVDTCDAPTFALSDTPIAIDEGATWSESLSFVPDARETWGDRLHRVTVDYGDGSSHSFDSGPSFTLEHVWAQDGAYTLSVTVVDADSRETVDTRDVSVRNVLPALAFAVGTATQIDEGGHFTADVTLDEPSSADRKDMVVWAVYGDDAQQVPLTRQPDGSYRLDHVYANDSSDAPGDAFTLQVFADDTPDDPDGIVSRSRSLTVTNIAPRLQNLPADNTTFSEGGALTRIITVTDPGAEPIHVTVRYDNGSADDVVELPPGGGSVTLSSVYAQNRTYSVSVTASDDDTDTVGGFDLIVGNVRPFIPAIADVEHVDEGSAWTRVVAIEDAGSDALDVSIDLGDQSPLITRSLGASERATTLTHTYKDNGVYVVHVSARDQDQDEGSTSFTVTVDNVAPLTGLPPSDSIMEGQAWAFDGLAIDPGADALSATVLYQTGDAMSPVSVATRAYHLEHTYARDSNATPFAVKLAVSDDDGATTTSTLALTVSNVAPTVQCGAATSLGEGVELVRTCTFEDPGDDTWTASVDWGDGGLPVNVAVDALTASFVLRHTYADENDAGDSYPVNVVVHDDDDQGMASFSVAVGNVPPLIQAVATGNANEGALWTQAGTIDTALPSDVISATVDYADGAGPTPLTVTAEHTFQLSHTWAQDGERKVVITAQDADGDVATPWTITVTVDNVRPTLSLGAAASLGEGGTLSRSVGVTDPGADTLVATVDYGLGDGPQATAIDGSGHIALSQVYPQDGAFTITLTVSDDSVTPTIGTLSVTVTNVLPTVVVGVDAALNEGQSLARTVNVSDPGSDPLSATVDFGDGSAPVTFSDVVSGSFTLTHAYRQDRAVPYTVTVSVSDDKAPKVATFTVAVANLAPSLTANASTPANEGSAWTLSGSVADAGLDDSFTACVRWTSGGACEPITIAAQGAFSANHTYPQDGSFNATVEVHDDSGGIDSETWSAAISNVAPSVTPIANVTGLGEALAYAGAVTFTDPGNDPHGLTIDWGDGTTPQVIASVASGVSVGHSYVDDGVYSVAIDVSDDDTSTRTTFSIAVQNRAPLVALDAATTTVLPNQTFTRTGRVTDPGTRDVLAATVDWDDESPLEDLVLGVDGGFSSSHVYALSGSYTVTVLATDGDLSTPSSYTVTVSDQAPIIAGQAPATLAEGDTLTREVTFTDPGSSAWFATVDYGDGDGAAPIMVDDALGAIALAHTYGQDGSYTVTLRVSDEAAFLAATTSTQTFVVTVTNVLPAITFGTDASVAEGGQLLRSGSFVDPGADSWTGSIDWGDGGAVEALTLSGAHTFDTSHAYADDGVFTVTVRVNDDDGVATTTRAITVTNVAPTLTAANLSANAGSSVPVSAAIVDPGADTWTVTIDRGDGSPSVPANVNGKAVTATLAAYATPGDYTLAMTVTDDSDASTIKSVTLHIDNVAPTVTGGGAVTVNEGALATLGATFVDPGANTHTATVDWKDGSAIESVGLDELGRTVSASHTYADDGVYQVAIVVGDDHGGSGNATVQVTVNNVAPAVAALGDVIAIPDRRVQKTITWTDPGADTWDVSVRYAIGATVYAEDTFDDQSLRQVVIDRTLPIDGTFTVTVTVSDDNGGSHQRLFGVTARQLDCGGAPTSGNIWTGLVGTSWNTAGNWLEGTPGASGSAIVCAGNSNAPIVAQDTAVGTLEVADAASLSVSSGATLTINSAYDGGSVGGPGTLELAGSEAAPTSARGTVAALRVSGYATSDDVVASSVTVASTGVLRPDSESTLTITNDLTLNVNATPTTGLLMIEDATIVVGRDLRLVAATNASTQGQLTAGRIEIGRDLVESGAVVATPTWYASGTTIAFGSGAHVVTLTSASASRFADLSIAASSSVTATVSPLTIAGTLSLGSSSGLTATTVVLSSALPSLGIGASYTVTTTSIVGDITLTSDVSLPGAAHTLAIAKGAALRLAGYDLTVAGSMLVNTHLGSGTGLYIGVAASMLRVVGNLTFAFTTTGGVTPAPAEARLGAGVISVGGDVVASSSDAAYTPLTSSGTTLILAAASAPGTQRIDVSTAPASTLAALDFSNVATLKLDGALSVGALIHSDLGAQGLVTPGSSGSGTLAATNVALDDVMLSQVPLTLTLAANATGTQLEDVVFAARADQTPLVVRLDALGLGATRLMFPTVPNASHHYLEVAGLGAATPTMTISDSLPLNGSAKSAADHALIVWGASGDDSDSDGLSDSFELGMTNPTDPLDEDSDDDGYDDGVEVRFGSDPNSADSEPFATAATTTVGASPATLALGDLDQDGDLDVAVGLTNSSTVLTILTNTGGSFSPTAVARTTACTNCKSFIAVGELFVPAMAPVARLEVLISDGVAVYFAALAPPAQPATGPEAWSAQPAAMLSSAGVPCPNQSDVAMHRRNSSNAAASAIIACGGSNRLLLFDIEGMPPSAASWANVDVSGTPTWLAPIFTTVGDPYQTIAVGKVGSNAIALVNDGASGLSLSATSIATSGALLAVADADADGDDQSDVGFLYQSGSSRAVSFRLAESGAWITSVAPITVASDAVGLALGDLDEDGEVDVLVGSSATPQVTLYLGASGAAYSFDVAGTKVLDVALGDIDGDGRTDIVALTDAGVSIISQEAP